VALVGGVAANQRLRDQVRESAKAQGMTVFLPSVDLCGDNAAMIAASGYYCLKDPARPAGEFDMDVYSRAARNQG
jgi:N6-L-threonylcarbamoyladenine synthase